MNLRRPLAWLVAFSIAAAVSPAVTRAQPAPAADLDPGRDQFTRVRHAEPAAGSPFTSHPLFNAGSCAECHRLGGVGGGGPAENDVRLITGSTSHALPIQFHTERGVTVLHRRSLEPGYADWRLHLIGNLDIHDPELPESIKAQIADEDARRPPAGTIRCTVGPRRAPFERRNTPPLFGLGLIDSIDQSTIDAVAASRPKWIRGRSPRLADGSRGRFGWKANTATLAAFNEEACASELGLSTPRFSPGHFRKAVLPTAWDENRPADFHVAPILRAFKSFDVGLKTAPGKTPDMTEADLAALTRFVARLPAPRQVVDPTRAAEITWGEAHFHAIGCAVCHVPKLGNVSGLYSDLLLHTVGTSGGDYYGESQFDIADFVPDLAHFEEFRTPPLWGLADSGPYMHDGGSATVEDAILRHKGQAGPSNVRYQGLLTDQEREELLLFLNSLRAP